MLIRGHTTSPPPTSGAKVEWFTHHVLGLMTSRSGFACTFDLRQARVKVYMVTVSGGDATGNAFAYAYDGFRRRVQEVDVLATCGEKCTTTTYPSYFAYVGHELSYVYNATSGASSAFVYLNGEVLFRVDSGSSTAHFYAYDMAGNVHGVWSYAGGAIVVEAAFRYKPFGEPATPLVMPSTDPRFRYASQDLSTATKLIHMGARYYAPDLGRFTSRDPVGSHGYAYARDDPMVYWDPSGLEVIVPNRPLFGQEASPHALSPYYHRAGRAWYSSHATCGISRTGYSTSGCAKRPIRGGDGAARTTGLNGSPETIRELAAQRPWATTSAKSRI